MYKYIIMVFAGACSFGLLSTCVKLANSQGYQAAELSFLQAAIGCITLSSILFFQEKRRIFDERLNKKTFLFLLFTGACIGITTFLYYQSVYYIPASLAIVILMQFTWLAVLFDWLLFKIRPEKRFFWVIMLILIGTVLASGFCSALTLTFSLKGITLSFLSALFYAGYTVASSKTTSTVNTIKKSAAIMAGSSIGIFLLNGKTLISAHHFDGNLLQWGVFLALFGTIIPPILFTKGIPKVGAGISAIIMTVELPVAMICAHFVLQEQIEITQWFGVLIMIIAIIVMNNKKKL